MYICVKVANVILKCQKSEQPPQNVDLLNICVYEKI